MFSVFEMYLNKIGDYPLLKREFVTVFVTVFITVRKKQNLVINTCNLSIPCLAHKIFQIFCFEIHIDGSI